MQDILVFFKKGFCTVYFGAYKNNAVTLPHNAQRKHAFTGKIKDMSKKNKLPLIKKIDLVLLHQRLGHRSTRSLLYGDTANVWGDVEPRIDPDPFCISCQISSMNKKDRSKIPLKPKAPFKWVFMDIILSTAPKSLTTDTIFLTTSYGTRLMRQVIFNSYVTECRTYLSFSKRVLHRIFRSR